MGGLARKASIIDEETLKGNSVIVLDSGDLFFSKSTLYADKDNIDEAKIRAEIIVNCNNEMDHSAFSPGSRDFALGLAYLKKLKDQSNFNFTSCNLFHQNTSDRIFDSYAIEDINGFKVGYIGAASSFQKDSILVKEPINEIKKIDPSEVAGIKLFLGSSTGKMLIDNLNSIENIFSDITNNFETIIGEGQSASLLDDWGWIGTLTELTTTDGYWIVMTEPDSLHIMGEYINPNIIYNLHAGPNLISFPTAGSVGISEGLPDDIEENIIAIMQAGYSAINTNDGWQGSLLYFEGLKGYWIITDFVLRFF